MRRPRLPGPAVFGVLVLAVTLLTSGSAMTAGSDTSAAAAPPLYGLYSGPPQERESLYLTKLHPRTLAPIGSERVALARLTFAGRSPDGRFAGFYERQPARLRVIDLDTMRVRGDLLLRVGKRWRIREAAWLTADRIVFVVQLQRGSYEQIVQTRQIVVVDPLALRVVARRPFANAMALNVAAQGGDRLVLLLGRGDYRDNKRLLATISSSGRLRTASLTLEGSPPSYTSLVVEPSGRRAFVIAAGSPVLEIELETMQVARHPVSGADRVFAASRYSNRRALWIGENTLAVSGTNQAIGRNRETSSPVGLAFVDTTTWQARVIDPQATGMTYSAGTLLAYGWRLESVGARGKPRRQRATGIGLRAYEPSGVLRWRRFAGQPLSANATRDVALVYRIPSARPGGSFPVELATGRQVGPVRRPEVNIWPLPEPTPPTRAPSAAARELQAIELDGDGEMLSGTAREDVSRVVAVLVDGSEQELPLDNGQFAFRADSPERSTRLVRAYAGDTLLATVSIPVRCGGSAGPCGASPVAPAAPTYAFLGVPPTGDARLVRVDPRTLVPLRRGLELKTRFVPGHARSPDGRSLAIGLHDRAQLRIIDLERLTPTRTIDLAASARTSARALAWLADDRLVAIVQRSSPGGRYVRERTAIVIDPNDGRIVSRQPLTNKLALHGSVHAAGRLVLMLQSSSHKGSSVQLVVIGADGTVRTRAVEVGKRAGVLHTTQLAVAPNGKRAFLLGWAIRRDTPPVLEIDLETLAVRARTIRVNAKSLPRAGLSTLRVGAVDDRYVAAVGAVAASEKVDGDFGPAAGIFLIDTESWTATLIDPRAVYFQVHDGKLVTYGPSSRLQELRRRHGRGSGVSAYAPPARRLYHLYGDRPFTEIELAGSYGHVLLGPPRTKRLVFDAGSGKPLGMLPTLELPVEVLGPPPPAPPAGNVRTAPPGERKPAAAAVQAAPDDPFASVSNRGTRVQAKAEKPGEREVTPRDLFLLRRDEGSAVYRIGGLRPGYNACYATGPAADLGRLGSTACGRSDFPSRRQPLFDLSSAELRRGEKQPRLFRLTGVAADAIAEIGLTDARGNVVARVPVEGNVYVLASPPPEATGSLVAYDRDGAIVYRTSDRGQTPSPAPPTSTRRLAGFRIKLTLPDGWSGEIRRSSAGQARALVLASNRLPFRDRRSVSLALVERDPRSEPRFPPVAAPPRIAATGVRASGRGGRFEREFTLKGRQFELRIVFGSAQPAPAVLAQVNRLLSTLQVGAVAVPPTPAAAGAPIQQGRADGVAVDVHRSGLVVFRFDPAGRLYRLLGGKRVSVACLTFDSVSPWEPNSWGASKPLAPTVQFIVNEATRPQPPYATLDPATEARPPFDGCLVSGSYGRRWNDPRGQRSPAEISFTARGRRFFDERAVARDLALFVRSPVLAQIRRSLKQGASAPTAAAIARRYPPRVVALPERNARLRYGQIGLWSDGTNVVEASALSRQGKRLFVELRGGRIGRHNLHGLAFVF